MTAGELIAEVEILAGEDEHSCGPEFRSEAGEKHVQVTLVGGIKRSPVDDDQVLVLCLKGYVQVLDLVEVRVGG